MKNNGNSRRRAKHIREGNVCIGWRTPCFLALDVDTKREYEVTNFAEEYPKVQSLGNSLVIKTSDRKAVFFGDELSNNYAIVFGRRITTKEQKWHIHECYRLGIINKGFHEMREFDCVTIRANWKNKRIPPPSIVRYFSNGDRKQDREGIIKFLEHWVRCRNEGID